MSKHIAFFTSLLAFIFVVEGLTFIVSAKDGFSLGFVGSAFFSLFIAFVHFFIAFGLVKRKKWAPHLGIFFEAYLILNFLILNFKVLFSSALLPSAITLLSVSAFLTASLFILRKQFTE